MNKVIIVDTMVWTYIYEKNKFFDDATQILGRFIDDGFRFAINSVIEHEFLRGRVIGYEKYFAGVTDVVDKIDVDHATFIKAVDIFKVQRVMADRFEKMPGKYLGDVLIAATAFLKGCYILTANLKDFPVPLFNIKNSDVLMKKGEGNSKNILTKIETIYLLEPNFSFVEIALSRLNDLED